MIFELKSKQAMNCDVKKVLDIYPTIKENFFVREIDQRSFIIINRMNDMESLTLITHKDFSVNVYCLSEHIQDISFNGELTIND